MVGMKTQNQPSWPLRGLLMAVVAGGALTGCGLKIDRDVDAERPRYHLTNASQMYFRNVRQSAYLAQEVAGNDMVVYRRPDPDLPDGTPHLRPAIALNARYDEAYVLVEPNAWFADADTIRVQWATRPGSRADSSAAATGSYRYVRGNKDDHFRFATRLQQSLLKDHLLTVVAAGDTVALLENRDARAQFRKTMVDFYHLVGLD